MIGARGAVVVDEFILPVVDIRLANESFTITAEVCGPVRAVSTDRYTVHDNTGKVVYRSVGTSLISWRELAAADMLTVTLECRVTSREAAWTGTTTAEEVS